ncbi:hypothetical protein [Noviherbaspirillum saxi]|uniref:Uncharacterized protein n=1 Tax=Noviherbaspirillum saxi TaxID=2320863 RepID=A0A3A3FIK0_9BURK|nr:hypothetical protein [Noviherbaspirillum saxi]RJF92218.1 hypothetical protein D3871_26660 [Noviherbaspirillum saxi]
MDERVFSISTPIPPDNEFVTYRPSLSLQDSALFEKANEVKALNVHWTFRSGLLRQVAGVAELKVHLYPAHENEIKSSADLRAELLSAFKRELVKVGYTGGPVQFYRVVINGRTWLTYEVPVIGVREFAIAVSDTRYLTVQLAYIDNTREKPAAWRKEAAELMEKVIGSIRVD